jgi:hypothetical protein
MTATRLFVYMAVVTKATECRSSRSGAPVIQLVLVPLPRSSRKRPAYLVTNLVRSDRGNWTIDNFLCSAGIRISPLGAEISITPAVCLRQVVYPLVDPARDHRVVSLLSRKEALKRNPALGRIPFPTDWPPPINAGHNIQVSYEPVS